MAGPTQDQIDRSLTNIKPSEAAIADIEDFREVAKGLNDALFTLVPESRERSIAVQKLEELVMWAVKGIVLAADTSDSDDGDLLLGAPTKSDG